MRGLLSIFTGAISKAGGAKAERRTAERLQHVEDDPFDELVKGDRFEPGGCYFSVRLAGLHLVDARRLASEVPAVPPSDDPSVRAGLVCVRGEGLYQQVRERTRKRTETVRAV